MSVRYPTVSFVKHDVRSVLLVIMSHYWMYQATYVSMFSIPVKWYKKHTLYDYCEFQSIAIY